MNYFNICSGEIETVNTGLSVSIPSSYDEKYTFLRIENAKPKFETEITFSPRKNWNDFIQSLKEIASKPPETISFEIGGENTLYKMSIHFDGGFLLDFVNPDCSLMFWIGENECAYTTLYFQTFEIFKKFVDYISDSNNECKVM